MTEDEIKFLKSKVDNGSVNVIFHDGEEAVGKLISVLEREKDIIYDHISTNKPRPKAGEIGESILARFQDIKSVS